MTETIITWNVPNWITITLMAFLGFAAINLIGAVSKRYLMSKTEAVNEDA